MARRSSEMAPQEIARPTSEATGKRRPGRPTRDSDDAKETHARLLRAATTLFARYGYESVSTGDIAKAANFTQSMVHYHFGSKLQIWKAVVTELMQRRGPLFSPTRLRKMQLDPIEKLELLIRALAAANAKEPDYARIVMQESIANNERLDWMIAEYIGPGFKLFDEVIAEAQRNGYLKNIPLHDVTNIVTSTVSLTFSLGPVISRIYGIDPNSEQYLDQLSASIIEVLFRGLRPKESSN